MRFRHLNFVHLVYLVAVAREGSVTRAAAALHVSPQTISGQLRVFGERVGGALTRRVGRGIELTPLGRDLATKGAALLDQSEALLAGDVAQGAPRRQLTVGVSPIVPPLLARRWLQPMIAQHHAERIVCVEGRERELWESLAVRRVDVIVVPSLPPASRGFHTVELARTPVALYGNEAYARKYRGRVMRALREAPLLVPTESSAARRVLEGWWALEGITPHIVGEFDDNGLRDAFAANGLGLFIASALLEKDLQRAYGLRRIGSIKAGPEARFFAATRARELLSAA